MPRALIRQCLNLLICLFTNNELKLSCLTLFKSFISIYHLKTCKQQITIKSWYVCPCSCFCIYLCSYVCLCLSNRVHVYLCSYVCLWPCIHICIYLSSYVCLHLLNRVIVYLCSYVCLYLWSHVFWKSVYRCQLWPLCLPIHNRSAF